MQWMRSWSSRSLVLLMPWLSGCGGSDGPIDVCAASTASPSLLVATDSAGRTIATRGSTVYFSGYVKSVNTELSSMPAKGGEVTGLDAFQPASLAVDDTHAYVTSGSVMARIRLSDKVNEHLFENPDGDSLYVTLHGDSYYFVATNGLAASGHTIFQGKKSGGAPSAVVPIDDGHFPYQLHVDSSGIYFVTHDNLGGSFLWKAPLTGGDPVKLASEVSGGAPLGLDDEAIYYVDVSGMKAQLMRLPKEGGESTAIFTDLTAGGGFAVYENALYLGDIGPSSPDPGEGRVWRLAKDGSCSVQLASSQLIEPGQMLAAGDSGVYWMTSEGVMWISGH